MSTRSQIVIKNEKYNEEQWFYRHSDGYPSGNLPQLYKFMKWKKEGRIRDNVEQSAGWLILIGAEEYNYTVDKNGNEIPKKTITEPNGNKNDFISWKCGAYELCTCGELHGDVEWLYTIDLSENTITIAHIRTFDKKKFTFRELEKYKDNWDKISNIITR